MCYLINYPSIPFSPNLYAQGFLKKMLPKKVVALLNPAEDKLQHTRSITFVDGLNQASDTFVRKFKVTKPGLQRAHWADGPDLLKQKVVL